jgi:hypothetical protein
MSSFRKQRYFSHGGTEITKYYSALLVHVFTNQFLASALVGVITKKIKERSQQNIFISTLSLPHDQQDSVSRQILFILFLGLDLAC